MGVQAFNYTEVCIPVLQHAFKLYKAGMSDVDVARSTGIKRTTFIRYRKKYKIFKKELLK